ncbi:type II toxin-antitoxin system PemK/MazF family toxin [Candidatus Woesearchaeota archaeon]|nr:type II toxin-antitoxin system PemK/MazF family toxin [Candidatus Woesearchaeota archaeon]
MGTFVKGEVVVLPFPFSDLSGSKKRPALIIAALTGDDVVLCQITSEARTDEYSVVLNDSDFKAGRLQVESRIRPNRIFTAEKSIISYKIGSLKESKIEDVDHKLKLIFEL